MSQPYTCPECGYYTAFGNAARISLHNNVSHAGNGETAFPANPITGLFNVTHEEVVDARAATEDVPLVRDDGTLTRAGIIYVAGQRRAAIESEEDYVRACDAQHAANPHRFEGEL